jgi:hypothetical protein
VVKILRKVNELLLGQQGGWLEVFDISSTTITRVWQIKEAKMIWDIVAIDEAHLLLATNKDLLKTKNS